MRLMMLSLVCALSAVKSSNLLDRETGCVVSAGPTTEQFVLSLVTRFFADPAALVITLPGVSLHG
jgi:hypothetical protein